MSLAALLVAVSVSLVPTVLFLGLWRGLLRLRRNALQHYGDPSGQSTELSGAFPAVPSDGGYAARLLKL